ncbi:MAG TPA: Xaa-Pro peptidase family protein [Candidatus Bathyarchaeia archaeon]|nr:Xaa-Pro peptidase family protein [Candidatus Bathyarchaeia archaeon]
MITDLDREMEKKDVNSIIVFGDSTNGNPDFCYVVGASIARGGIYLKRKSHEPTLIVSNIDVGSAKKGRVRNIRTYSDYGFERISAKYDRDEARARFYEKIIKDTGLEGPIVIAGKNEASNTLHLIDALRKKRVKIVGEKAPTIVEIARETKDRRELERLRDMGKRTSRVVERTLRFLKGTRVKGSKVLYRSKPLKVGDVKTVIGRLLADESIIAPEDTIFAPGRRSSDPHYNGEARDLVRARDPIVFDIFPAEPDGYWHDCTRTYTFSTPSRALKEMYDAVLEAQTLALDNIREQVPCKDVMIDVCKLFEKRGYPTVRSLAKGNKEARVRGFIHGLGHGVGLTIGERPYLSLYGDGPLRKNSVVTVEPGLYDPKIGGVRIEDIVVVGSPSENLTPLSKDMEL